MGRTATQHRTAYAWLGDQSIAYQVVGTGEVDVLVVPAMVSHVELIWGDPAMARFLKRMASFARLIIYDKLGTGLSDPLLAPASIEDRAREAIAVLDAAGSEQAAVFGLFDGGATAAFLAVTRPERVTSVAMFGTHPVGAMVPDAPHWEDGDWAERFHRIESLVEGWGDGATMAYFAGTRVNLAERASWATFERASASPGVVRTMVREFGERDLRDLLGHVTQPTLILHPENDHVHPIEQGELIARLVPNARLVPLRGPTRWPWSCDPETLLAEARQHVTGVRDVPEQPETFGAILFTDIVGSTELAARLGDQRWRQLLESVVALSRELVAAHDGNYVKSTGDGSLALFDGPGQAIRCARELLDRAPALDVALRAGIHAGTVEELHHDIGGLAVHVAARICDRAAPGEVLVSEAARVLVAGSGLRFADRGVHDLKGLADPWRLSAAGTEDSPPLEPIGAQLRLRDRAAVAVTRRAPGVVRLATRLVASRSGHPAAGALARS